MSAINEVTPTANTASDTAHTARRFFENEDHVGLRFAGWSHSIVNLRYTGWYADNHQDEVLRGAVFRLSARHGQERFVAGYCEDINDSFVLDLSGVWADDLIGAAREADRLAERAAEDEREYQARESATMRMEEIADEIKDIRTQTLELCASIRNACPAIGEKPPIRKALRQALQTHLNNRKALVCERGRLREDFWSVVLD